ncbi:YncE family protein [Actinocorallia aurea]
MSKGRWRALAAAVLLAASALTAVTAPTAAHAAPQSVAYVANVDSDNVTVMDASSLTVSATITGIGTDPYDIALNPAGTRLYTANQASGNVSRDRHLHRRRHRGRPHPGQRRRRREHHIVNGLGCTITGTNGNDALADASGTDTMSGNLGNDDIDVHDGAGGDTANGGLGSDTCATDGGDTATSC